jgi:hypothetical protein
MTELTGLMGLTGGRCCVRFGGQEFNRLFMQKIEECFASFGDDRLGRYVSAGPDLGHCRPLSAPTSRTCGDVA